jgi:mono/diheme cytochrome c family protein
MTTRRNSSYTSYGRSGGRLVPFLLGFLFALVAVAAASWAYLRFSHLPVATADPAFPFEAQIVRVPLEARIEREMQKPPFGTSEDVFEAGAKIYVASCASCHGSPGRETPYGRWMFPQAPQLWKRHRDGSFGGVSDDDAGETFWKIKNGIRLSGMPSYRHLYSDAQMWDVALLLKNADQPLPDPVMNLLQQSSPAAAPMGPVR